MIILSRRRSSPRDDGGRPDELVEKHEDVLRARREATARLPLRRTDYAGAHASESRACQPHAGRVEREHEAAPGTHARAMPEHRLAASSGSRRRARGTRQASRAAGHAQAASHAAGRDSRALAARRTAGREPRWPCRLHAALRAGGLAAGAGHTTRLAEVAQLGLAAARAVQARCRAAALTTRAGWCLAAPAARGRGEGLDDFDEGDALWAVMARKSLRAVWGRGIVFRRRLGAPMDARRVACARLGGWLHARGEMG
jgi:hypothetical protein